MLPDKERGFIMFTRELAPDDDPEQRLEHYKEFFQSLPPDKLKQQAYRCMNCGIPFCHHGCPLGNMIPDFNDLVKEEDWEEALRVLHSTNNFPEFTGRVCPAPCEGSCVLGINEPPVAIEMIEREIGERGWREGWIQPMPPEKETGKRVAIVGSGPAGLAAAQQLRRAGHAVTVFERADEPGGLLMYGIPAFKLDKQVVFRRVAQMKAEGVEFRCGVEVGKDLPVRELDEYDAVLLAIGSTVARTFKGMDIPGSDLDGICVAMDFLPQQTRRVLGKPIEDFEILATGKDVVVLGGGDTGSDCVGTSLRQKCRSLLNLELMPKPPAAREGANFWPLWPLIFRTSSSHEEGKKRFANDVREYSILTKRFEDDGNGRVCALHTVEVEWGEPDETGRRKMVEKPGTERRIPCDLVLLAMGFVQPESAAFEEGLGLQTTRNRFGMGFADTNYRNKDKYFVAGDCRRGQSLVVWAIAEGREAARAIDVYLEGYSDLPGRDTPGYDTLEDPALRA